MAEIRTLKLNLLADTKAFAKGLQGASGASKTFAGRLGQTMRKATIAMGAAAAAAGYLAVRLGTDAVKAAMDDEASQVRLAKILHKTTKATDAQVKSTEKWITAQQFAKGFSDTELRAALGRLTAATHNQRRAQELLIIAQDTAKGTGRDLDQVTVSLAKAYEGNLGALTRLGIPLDKATIKSGDFNAALKVLTETYGGQADTWAGTFAGKMSILNQQLGELKESVGSKLIDAFSKVLPKAQAFMNYLLGNDPNSMNANARESREAIGGNGPKSLATAVREVAGAFSTLIGALAGTSSSDANDNLNSMAQALRNVAGAINAVAGAINYLSRTFTNENWLRGLSFLSALDPGVATAFSSLGRFVRRAGPSGTRAVGGTVRAGGSYLVGEHGPELLQLGAQSGYVTSNGNLGGGTTVINLNGIVDAESARRAIERIIQQSSRRTGAVNWAGALG